MTLLDHVQGGTVVMNTVAALRSFADKSQPESPIRQLVNDELIAWYHDQAQAGKRTNLIQMFREADSARGLLQLKLQAAVTRAQLAEAEIKKLQGKVKTNDASRWALSTRSGRIEMQDLRTSITPINGALVDMGFLFAVHTPCTLMDLYWALDTSRQADGFGGRIIGTSTRLIGFQWMQNVTDKQRADYGATLSGFVKVSVKVLVHREKVNPVLAVQA